MGKGRSRYRGPAQQADLKANAGKLAPLKQAAELYDQAAALLRNAMAKADEFITGLGIADAKGVLLITKLAQEKSVCERLTKENTLALVLDLRAAVGGYYTKKNVWTFLGQMPFFAMGGAVVTYLLLDGDGQLVATGLVPIHSGYQGVHKVPDLVNGANPKQYKLTVSASPGADGTVDVGGTFVAERSWQTVTATPKGFVNWTQSGEVMSTSPSYTFMMPSANVTLVANFEPTARGA
jgi:hypothetical protein